MRIGLTYDMRSEYIAMGYGREECAEFDREDTIAGIEKCLQDLGHETDRIGHIRALPARLAAAERWDLVFNIAEGFHGISREAQVPALLEAYRIPYTGSDPLTLALSHHKGFTKEIVRCAGVPTPPFCLVSDAGEVDKVKLPFPLFVKPVAEGTGKGISSRSRVTTPQELCEQCAYVIETFNQPAIVETYLPGREITVGVLGSGREARIVGAIEICSLQGAEQHAYSFFNKENYEKVISYSTVTDSSLLKEAEKICIDAWEAVGGRDACRVDLRADDQGRLSFIEMNALPGLNPTHSDLPIICNRVGIPFSGLIGSIVDSARQRYRI